MEVEMKGFETIDRKIEEKKGAFLVSEKIRVHNLQCDSCVSSLEELFMSIDGVQAVCVDYGDQVAEVTFDRRKTSLPLIHEVLMRGGYKKH
jgi:copper chaperone CopZ